LHLSLDFYALGNPGGTTLKIATTGKSREIQVLRHQKGSGPTSVETYPKTEDVFYSLDLGQAVREGGIGLLPVLGAFSGLRKATDGILEGETCHRVAAVGALANIGGAVALISGLAGGSGLTTLVGGALLLAAGVSVGVGHGLTERREIRQMTKDEWENWPK
jgi:hypothetical protein